MKLLTDRYKDKTKGSISFFDRVVIQGTIPGICYVEGMTSWLYEQKIRIFDFPKISKKWNEQIVTNAEEIARKNNLEIDFIRKKNFRKEKKIKSIIKERGEEPGLVWIFSVLESCVMYKPWHNKTTGRTYLKVQSGKCLHYYFYFIDKKLGLCYMRVPAWAPFRLQFYFNGHNLLANKFKKSGIQYELLENAFIHISNFKKANALCKNIPIQEIHKILDGYAKKLCPVIKHFENSYHWSIMQAEWATDIIFDKKESLKPMYDDLIRKLIHTVKPKDIATFLGKKIHGNFQGEMGNNFNTRIEGTKIRHSMGPASVKMYDKFGFILRIETTINKVNFFRHYRRVEHRDGTNSKKIASMKKSIYSMNALAKILHSTNKRYIEFISSIETNEIGIKKLQKISDSVKVNDRNYKGLNFYNKDDLQIMEAILSGENKIIGFRNRDIKSKLQNKSTGQISRILKRLRMHGIIKKTNKSYRYRITIFGNETLIMGLKLKEMYILPQLSKAA